MSDGYNRWIGLGSLGADAELRFGQSGVAVLSWRMACNESWYDDKAKERKERTEWVSCVLFGKRAEGLSKNLTKGTMLHVEGSLRTESYEKDGQKRYATKVYVNSVIFAGGGRGNTRSDEDSGARRQERGAPRQPAPPPDDFGGGGGDLGDIPFGPHNAHESW